MSAFSRLPKTPASGIVHKWPPIHAMPCSDELAYGQVRRISAYVTLLILARAVSDTWEVMVLSIDDANTLVPISGFIQSHTGEFLRKLPLVTP